MTCYNSSPIDFQVAVHHSNCKINAKKRLILHQPGDKRLRNPGTRAGQQKTRTLRVKTFFAAAF
jgi:hypothetical protein